LCVNLTRKSRFGSHISAAAVSAVVIVTRCSRNLSSALALSPSQAQGSVAPWQWPFVRPSDVRGGAQPLSASDIDLLYESVTPTDRKPTSRLGL
jgi:hypothetical protein